MLTPLPFVIVVTAGLIFGSSYYWARRQGLLATTPVAEGERGTRRVSLLTEAVAYVGAVLLLAGGIAGLSQRWNGLGGWGRAGVLAGAAVLFLVTGLFLHRSGEPAIQRLAGVLWFLSVACAGAAAGIATAAAAMAASVPVRNTPLLALATLAMFGYVTSAVIRYFRQSLGVPPRWRSPGR